MAKDLWRSVRSQLNHKADELAEIRGRHAQEVAALTEALEGAQAQAQQLQEDLFLRDQAAARREGELGDRVQSWSKRRPCTPRR